MKAAIAILLSHITAIALIIISAPPFRPIFIFFFEGVFIVASLLLTLCFTAWFKGSFKARFYKAWRLGFLTAILSFLAGYGFIILKTLILEA